jgi:gluconolactonase
MKRRQFVSRSLIWGAGLFAGQGITAWASQEKIFVEPGAKLEKLPIDFGFAEGPVADSRGDIYFSDWEKKRIYLWSEKTGISVFIENAPGTVGLDLIGDETLITASTDKRSIISINLKDKKETVLADRYHGIRLNSPNDLWCDPKGGVYFTDPRFVYMPDPVEQDKEGVYYLSPDRKRLVRVIGDLDKPNGLTGSIDGGLLYVDDTPPNKTFVYSINPDGTLTNKKLFAKVGFDGIKVDSMGNVYITAPGKTIEIFSPAGAKIGRIEVPQRPTNLCFGGKDRQTLFITTIKTAYTLKMRVKGIVK